MIPMGLLFNRYTAAAALVLFLGAAAVKYRAVLIQSGYDRAMIEVSAAQADTMRELVRERTRQQEILKGVQDAYTQQTADVAAFRARLRAADGRVRDQARDFEQRIAAASAASLRRHAAASDGNLERCIGDVERFAAEAASCSGAAHALKRNLDTVTTPKGPP